MPNPFPPRVGPIDATPADGPRWAGPMRPLSGVRILLVEDSRFASDALRLVAARLGARLRRADSLHVATRFLGLYEPDVLIVDLGLPDGRGETLIQRVAAMPDRRCILLGTSGDPEGRTLVMAAGADDFLPKPMPGIAAFLALIRPGAPAPSLPVENTLSDPAAMRDDLRRARRLIEADAATPYVTGFLQGLARAAKEPALLTAVNRALRQDDQPALLRILSERIALCGSEV